MTTEEKAKAYDEAIERAKSKIKNDKDHVLYEKDITDIFPALEESEDERIRKALKEYFINSFQNNGIAAICGVHIKDILAWLEKQGEQKNTWSEEDEECADLILRELKQDKEDSP